MKTSCMFPVLSALALAVIFGSTACSKGGNGGGGAASPDLSSKYTRTEMKRAKKSFATCAACHGPDGKAETDAAKAIGARSFHNAEWQKSVTDQYLFDIITKGGAAMGKKAAMTGYPNYDPKKHTGEIWALVQMVRDFGKAK